MAKKLFKNYSYEFDSNEIKVLSNFCKQVLKQMFGNDQFTRETKIFNNILDKLNEGVEVVKFTKDEKNHLVIQLKENLKHIEQQIKNSWFIKKWMYRTMFKQYSSLIEDHFTD